MCHPLPAPTPDTLALRAIQTAKARGVKVGTVINEAEILGALSEIEAVAVRRAVGRLSATTGVTLWELPPNPFARKSATFEALPSNDYV